MYAVFDSPVKFFQNSGNFISKLFFCDKLKTKAKITNVQTHQFNDFNQHPIVS